MCFARRRDLNRVVLPVSFDETKDAVQLNLNTRKTALNYLGQGGAIGIFPGGAVSTSATPFSRPMDPGWRNFTARMIAKSDATVVPVFFEGHCSRLFQTGQPFAFDPAHGAVDQGIRQTG